MAIRPPPLRPRLCDLRFSQQSGGKRRAIRDLSCETRTLFSQEKFTNERVNAIRPDYQVNARLRPIGKRERDLIGILGKTDKLLVKMQY
jgi:hypothetical protein